MLHAAMIVCLEKEVVSTSIPKIEQLRNFTEKHDKTSAHDISTVIHGIVMVHFQKPRLSHGTFMVIAYIVQCQHCKIVHLNKFTN